MTPPDAGGQGSIIVAPVIEYSVAPELLAQDLIPAERMDGVVAKEVEAKDLFVGRVAALADPKTPRQIGLQLAEAARRLPSGPVEVSLNPEELGRVKMVLTAGDGAITVSLSVERPETADLMRRNLANLGAEFRDLGYSDVRFSFSGDGDRGRPDHASPGMAAETGHAEAAPPGAADAPRQTAAATGRLDIRI